MKMNCPCAGLIPDCNKCLGKGYYEADSLINNSRKAYNISSESLETDLQAKHNQRVLIKCEKCGAFIRTDRIEKHLKKVHNVPPVLAIPKSNVPISPKSTQTIRPPSNYRYKIKAGILAPVPESYLERAVRDVFPLYGKVSFGSDMSKTEMKNMRDNFYKFKSVNVYLFYKNYTRYKAILIDEFYIYVDVKPHPKAWGSWNDNFKNYYTVTDIEECEIPITNFKHLSTKNQITACHRPCWIYDDF